MYDEVERHHNKTIGNDDYIGFEQIEEEEDDGITTKREGVLDLGLASDDSDDQEESSDSDGEEEAPPQESSDAASDNDDSSVEEEEETNVFNWGSKKHAYYHGDTADLEIGQDEDDALLEEEAGKEVQLARLEEMEEDDFMLQDNHVEKGKGGKDKAVKKKRQKSVLSRKDKMKLLKSSHPELMPVVDHFRETLEEFVEGTVVVGGALLKDGGKGNESEVGSFVCLLIIIVPVCICLMHLI
jgi:U3 small nucleolar RNA-associated protein 3